jgi:hypothetical protein
MTPIIGTSAEQAEAEHVGGVGDAVEDAVVEARRRSIAAIVPRPSQRIWVWILPVQSPAPALLRLISASVTMPATRVTSTQSIAWTAAGSERGRPRAVSLGAAELARFAPGPGDRFGLAVGPGRRPAGARRAGARRSARPSGRGWWVLSSRAAPRGRAGRAAAGADARGAAGVRRRGRLLAAEVGLDHLHHDRGGGVGADAAVLDEGDDDDLRVVGGGVGGEPGVVLVVSKPSRGRRRRRRRGRTRRPGRCRSCRRRRCCRGARCRRCRARG